MNIFEDLLEELREENLLEAKTVRTGNGRQNSAVPKEKPRPVETGTAVLETINSLPPVSNNLAVEAAKTQPTAIDESGFYRERAMGEVAFLQIVEHVFAGIEREQLKILPNPYDDLKVKKVLHSFLHLAPDADAADYSRAEFRLLEETQNWHSALSQRDNRLLTAQLRRYCETSRPPLSSPALVALARFYRNSPYSEQARSKFDLVVTRLFSKEIGENRREMMCSRGELIARLKKLYAEWSSVSLYSTDADDSQISQTVRQFADFDKEAADAPNFDQLLNTNFFNRLYSFKESTNEDFYEPSIAAAAIESNIRIGNRYVELLEKEKQASDITNLVDKYGFSYEQTISEATGKTFSFIDSLKQKKITVPPVESKSPPVKEFEIKENKKSANRKEKTEEAENTEKNGIYLRWIIITAILAATVLGVYFLT